MKGIKTVLTREWLMQHVAVDKQEHWIWQMAKFQRTGYGQVRAHGSTKAAHRVFYEVFVGPIPAGMFVLHNCSGMAEPGDHYTRACCNPAHLYLGTHAQNMKDMTRERRQSHGERHWPKTTPESLATGDRNGSRTHPERRPRGDGHWSRLSPEKVRRGDGHSATELSDDDVRAIRTRAASGEPYPDIAADYSLSPESVSNIARGKTWSHVVSDVAPAAPRGGVKGANNKRALLTEADIPVIRARAKAGDLAKDIAADYGVHKHTIYLIIWRKNWAHVP